jgi:hypothetical protein
MPDYAESSDDIIRNVLTFDHGKLGNANEKQFYRSQLKNIRHFVALPSEGEHIFAPGNFTIYKANDLLKRLGYGDRSGGEPPRILKTVGTRVGFGDSGYRELEAEFLSACTDLGIKPSSH